MLFLSPLSITINTLVNIPMTSADCHASNLTKTLTESNRTRPLKKGDYFIFSVGSISITGESLENRQKCIICAYQRLCKYVDYVFFVMGVYVRDSFVSVVFQTNFFAYPQKVVFP